MYYQHLKLVASNRPITMATLVLMHRSAELAAVETGEQLSCMSIFWICDQARVDES